MMIIVRAVKSSIIIFFYNLERRQLFVSFCFMMAMDFTLPSRWN